MFFSRSKWIALGLMMAAVATPAASAESPLAAKTEAAGYKAITQYLVQHASRVDTAALAAKTEAAGYKAITQYLVQHASRVDTAALAAKTEAKGFIALQPKPVVAPLGAQTEAKGYRALVRYQVQRAATPASVSSSATAFDWGDASIGAAMTIGVLFLLAAATAITMRRREGFAGLRP
jgi:hypothetical protein